MMPKSVTKGESRKINTKYGEIKTVKQFKHLEEVITDNAN